MYRTPTMTKMEKQRFQEFKKAHPDARRRYEYPVEIGYRLYVVSKKDNIQKEITDDNMSDNV